MHNVLPPAAAIAGSTSQVRPPSRGSYGPVFAALTALIAGATACDRESGDADEPAEPIVAFDTSSVRIETTTDTLRLHVEVAESPQQRAHGMMERDHLAPDDGMLFLFTSPQDSSSGMYMYRVRIPLDVAFIDENGHIVSVRTMQPCESPNPGLCRTYTAGASFSSVLEVNAGYFAEHGIDVGDRVVHEATNETAETE